MCFLFSRSDVLTEISVSLPHCSLISQPHRLWSFTDLACAALAVFCIRLQATQAVRSSRTELYKHSLETFPSHHKVSIWFPVDKNICKNSPNRYFLFQFIIFIFHHKGVTGTWLNVNVLNLSACLTERGMLFPSQRLFSSKLSHLIMWAIFISSKENWKLYLYLLFTSLLYFFCS